MVAPKAEFVYLPSLIWVPTGIRKASELVLPLNRFIVNHGIGFRAASVVGLENGGRTVVTDQGEIPNDYLLIATGGRFLRGMPGIEHALTLCDGVSAAEKIGERLRKMERGSIAFGFGGNPKEPSAMRGGPMFELLFGVDTWLRQQGKRDKFTSHFSTPRPSPASVLVRKPSKGCSRRCSAAAYTLIWDTRSAGLPKMRCKPRTVQYQQISYCSCQG